MNPLIPTIATVLACALSMQSAAQVIRCTDPRTGKITFTDGKCTGGESGVQVQERPTPEQIQADRQQAQEAMQRERMEQAADERRRRSETAQASPAVANSPVQTIGRSESAECKTALRDMDTAQRSIANQNGVPAARAAVNAACATNMNVDGGTARRLQPHVQGAVVPNPVRSATVTSCDAGGCWDNRGARYNRSGNVFLGPGGRTCQQTGSTMRCQ